MTTLLEPRLVAPVAHETPWTLTTLGRPAIAFVVYGTPAPQGSKKQVATRTKGPRKGQAILVESSKKVKPWREEVARVARQAVDARPGWSPLFGPLVADMVFTLDRPARFPWSPKKPWDTRRVHAQHTTYPDLSKLLRSTEDALSGIVWRDDAQVIGYRRDEKMYVGTTDTDALRRPGVVIRLWHAPQSTIDARIGAS